MLCSYVLRVGQIHSFIIRCCPDFYSLGLSQIILHVFKKMSHLDCQSTARLVPVHSASACQYSQALSLTLLTSQECCSVPHRCPRLGHCVGRAAERQHLSEGETETIKKQIQGVPIQRDWKNSHCFQIWQLSPFPRRQLNGCGQCWSGGRGGGQWV